MSQGRELQPQLAVSRKTLMHQKSTPIHAGAPGAACLVALPNSNYPGLICSTFSPRKLPALAGIRSGDQVCDRSSAMTDLSTTCGSRMRWQHPCYCQSLGRAKRLKMEALRNQHMCFGHDSSKALGNRRLPLSPRSTSVLCG